jgi:hypothetical protein
MKLGKSLSVLMSVSPLGVNGCSRKSLDLMVLLKDKRWGLYKGYSKKKCEDFFDTYSPVPRLTTIRVLLYLAASHGLIVHQMDVKTTFLNGELDEEIYMEQPAGFVANDQEGMVCKLLKSYMA